MNNYNETAKKIADKLYEKIESIFTPMGMLTFVVNSSKYPIFSLEHPFDPMKGKAERTDLAFEVLADENTQETNGMNTLLAVIKNTEDHEVFMADAQVYLDMWCNDDEESQKRFAEHFLKELGMSSNELKRKIAVAVVTELLNMFPKEIVDEAMKM